MERILSIDGGGTKTLGVLYDEKGNEIDRWLSGPSSIHVDFEKAWQSIATIIDKAVKLNPFVVLGISGAGSSDKATEIQERIAEKYDLESELMSDIQLSYYAHHGLNSGVDVIAGTGSVSMAFTGSEFVMSGGWGPKLGDEGSAYGIVRALVRELLLNLEEGQNLDHVEAVLKALGVKNRSELVQWAYAQERTAFAAAAKDLVAIDNALVDNVLVCQAEALAEQTARLLPKIKGSFEIALTGSVFDRNALFSVSFQEKLNDLAGNDLVYQLNKAENIYGGYRYYDGKRRNC